MTTKEKIKQIKRNNKRVDRLKRRRYDEEEIILLKNDLKNLLLKINEDENKILEIKKKANKIKRSNERDARKCKMMLEHYEDYKDYLDFVNHMNNINHEFCEDFEYMWIINQSSLECFKASFYSALNRRINEPMFEAEEKIKKIQESEDNKLKFINDYLNNIEAGFRRFK